jgi:ATP synthase protein I
MLEPEERARLDALSKRIEAARAAEAPKQRVAAHPGQAQAVWRMVTELVAGLLIGFGIGYGLDVVFGTLPWLLVLFTLLGFAAGVRVMLRTATELAQGAAAAAAAGEDGPRPADEAGPAERRQDDATQDDGPKDEGKRDGR